MTEANKTTTDTTSAKSREDAARAQRARAEREAREAEAAKANAKNGAAALPLDIQATAFQRRVWSCLQSIEFGKTRSYSDVAKAIKQPTAIRAVARACASNPVAIAIPCHRIVRSNGDMGGYRWGVARKAALLERERKAKAQST